MNLEIEDAEKELFKLVLYGHVNCDFEPMSEYAKNLFGYSMGSPFPKDKETRKKIFITDIDGVWNSGDQIFVGYLKRLAEKNTGVKNEFDHILEIIKDTRPGNIDGPVNRISEIFRECDVRLYQHEWSCKHAIDDIGLVWYGYDCLVEFGVMHYDVYCFSGSPNLAVKHFVARRMGLPANHGLGSEYNFESERPDAKFKFIDPLLYEYKRPAVEKVVKETTGSIKFLGSVLSDEPGDIKMRCFFVNPFILVDRVEELPEEKDSIIVKLPEFRDDARILASKLKKIDRALCFYFGYTQAEKENIFSSAFGIKKCAGLIESTENEDSIKSLRNSTLEYFNEYKSTTWKIFPLILSDIEKLADELESVKTIDEIKLASYNFWIEFRGLSPDADIAEIYYNLLN